MDVTLSTDEPAFAKNMLVYAFEEGDEQSPGKTWASSASIR